ncbi:4045_t:CDS:1 [Cetraspora pellucida]|uniref:4045_t:CDS:1 n=1 Tax=Cetraspora pellucida TaxID=1433469 RepID=A0A9N9II19_9GLOM|nr:4045_t:CDS:1 [Cetraspora pellucida]
MSSVNLLIMNVNKDKQTQNIEDKLVKDYLFLFNSDYAIVQKSAQANFEANFGYMSVNILKFLCQKLGISKTGSKQELVVQLVVKNKKRKISSEFYSRNEKISINSSTTAAVLDNSSVNFELDIVSLVVLLIEE